MDRRQLSWMLGLSALGTALNAEPSARYRFPGIYKLNFWKTTNPDGTVVEPLGSDPIGRITYHKSGHMSVQLMRRERKPPARIDLKTATVDELREALRQTQGNNAGFVAYLGTYTVDEAASTVTHHLEGGSGPTFRGSDFQRRYEFRGNLLYLSVPPNFNSKLEWERIADA